MRFRLLSYGLCPFHILTEHSSQVWPGESWGVSRCTSIRSFFPVISALSLCNSILRQKDFKILPNPRILHHVRPLWLNSSCSPEKVSYTCHYVAALRPLPSPSAPTTATATAPRPSCRSSQPPPSQRTALQPPPTTFPPARSWGSSLPTPVPPAQRCETCLAKHRRARRVETRGGAVRRKREMPDNQRGMLGREPPVPGSLVLESTGSADPPISSIEGTGRQREMILGRRCMVRSAQQSTVLRWVLRASRVVLEKQRAGTVQRTSATGHLWGCSFRHKTAGGQEA